MKRQTRKLMLLFALCLLLLPATQAQSYTIRFVPGTEHIDRGRGDTGRNLDELTAAIGRYHPQADGRLGIRLTSLQNMAERESSYARKQALQQAFALRDYLEEACCLGPDTPIEIHVDAQTDLENRVIAELVTVRHPHRVVTQERTPDVEPSPATPEASGTPDAAPPVAAAPALPASASRIGIGVSTDLLLLSGMAVNGPLYRPAPNLAVELYFYHRFSARLSFACGLPYNRGDEENVSKLASFSIEPRLWLRNDGSFDGLYAGVYGQYGTFDVRIAEKLADNCKGSYAGVGLSLGWLQPLWKGLYAEGGLQIGYRSDALDVYEYIPGEPYKQLAPYTLKSFTLQGVNVSVGYRF